MGSWLRSRRFPIAKMIFNLAFVVLSTSALLDIDFTDGADFSVSLAGIPWLTSVPIRFFAANSWQHLTRTKTVRSHGTDALGSFECINVSWSWAPVYDVTKRLLHTSLKRYTDLNTAIFVQQLPAGASGTNASNPRWPGGIRVMDPGNYPPVASFPAFSGERMQNLRYLTWQSRMVNAEWGRNVTGGPPARNEPIVNGTGLQGLSTSGPVVLFDTRRSATDRKSTIPPPNSDTRTYDHTAGAALAPALVISPLDNFKSAVHHVSVRTGADTGDDTGAHTIAWETGVTSELGSLPVGFEHRTVLVAGHGITNTLARWGRVVQSSHNTSRAMVARDKNVQYLSYWTDNGAYYSGGAWGEAGGGGDPVNETAFKAVASGLQRQGLYNAVRTWQLDDWWYHGRSSVYSNCVLNWSLPSSTFPSGLENLSATLGKPWLLYVPFWCPENVLSNQFRWIHSANPGNPQLIFAEPHPDDAARFYRYLLSYGKSVGMAGFEHDYLDYNYLSMPYLRRTYGAAHKWLDGLNTAALELDVPVQMCMALPSDVMASVQLDSVTNYRCSTDYGINDSNGDRPYGSSSLQPYDDNINIGTSSLLGWALGIRPSKDIFWTSRPDNCRNEDPSSDPRACGRWGAFTNPGSNCELNAIVATLSTGPVSIADKAGSTNATLVRRCIRADGRILQPDKPATTIDSLFAHDQATAPPGMISATSTALGSLVWHFVLSVDVAAPVRLQEGDFYPTLMGHVEENVSRQPNKASTMDGTSGSNTTTGSGAIWVVHNWFTGHSPTICANGSLALASGCVTTVVKSASDVPEIHNQRPVMVQNDTHTFDLMEMAPAAANGWVLLGETGKYVRVSKDRIQSIDVLSSGIRILVTGAPGEIVQLTALRPMQATVSFERVAEATEWIVLVEQVVLGPAGTGAVTFSASVSQARE